MEKVLEEAAKKLVIEPIAKWRDDAKKDMAAAKEIKDGYKKGLEEENKKVLEAYKASIVQLFLLCEEDAEENGSDSMDGEEYGLTLDKDELWELWNDTMHIYDLHIGCFSKQMRQCHEKLYSYIEGYTRGEEVQSSELFPLVKEARKLVAKALQ